MMVFFSVVLSSPVVFVFRRASVAQDVVLWTLTSTRNLWVGLAEFPDGLFSGAIST